MLSNFLFLEVHNTNDFSWFLNTVSPKIRPLSLKPEVSKFVLLCWSQYRVDLQSGELKDKTKHRAAGLQSSRLWVQAMRFHASIH
ncbi:hypothetical protein AMELA_G00187160 [Ameiurus melas]|uniref:Uncharacterized protein n=1 Tax=Ameiurus melas TaxID=219545 RepID=A0A7J6A821_AMEME|nr:hypothetical protein AMELA_G00187160 [Ameiurus melas]